MPNEPENLSAGTQVVALVPVVGPNRSIVHPRGAVGVVTRTPAVEGEKYLVQMIFQTFNGYAMSQFKKIDQDLRNRGEIRWKHAMHLLRLLLSGAEALRSGAVPVRVEAHRDRLLAVKSGSIPWEEVEAWRRQLHHDFERALAETRLPERPDYETANRLLLEARRRRAMRASEAAPL